MEAIEVNISWLLRDVASFEIVIATKSRRALCVATLKSNRRYAFEALHGWCARVASYFQTSVFTAQAQDKLDMGAINDNGVCAVCAVDVDARC